MRLFNLILIFFLSFTTPTISNDNNEIIEILKKGGNLVFIRHAYAPGGGDPSNFDINNCSTQRNLDNSGRIQAKKIGKFFKENQIPIEDIYSSNWCRCKETAKLAFKGFKTKSFLNSFFSSKFAHNRKQQMIDLNNFLQKWNGKDNLIFVTHYVVISEALSYAPASGEIVVSDKNLNKIGSVKINY